MAKFNEKTGYPWYFFNPGLPKFTSAIVTFLVVTLGIIVFAVYYQNGNDLTPDSIAGYAYAIAGTTFMLLAALRYTLYRISRKRGVGKLNTSLYWHISFGIIALAFLFMHSFGHLNPRTGTYALYGMIALVVSGIIGRTLDRIVPRLIAQEVRKALTEQGEDRMEIVNQTLQSIVAYNTQEVRTFEVEQQERAVAQPLPKREAILQNSWDLAYISLDETPQEIEQHSDSYRFVPDRKSALTQPETLLPGMQENLRELHFLQTAIKREQFYRYIIRIWRFFHILLAITTIGLTLWHLEYAAQLLIPTLFHH